MTFPIIKNLKKYWLTGILLILLVYSLFIQNFFLSSFDQAKQQASRWPMLSKPHLLLARAFFNTGSAQSIKELQIGKQSWLKNQDLIRQTETIVNQPRKINEEVNFWQEKINQGLENPQVYLNLAVLNYKIWEDQKARDYWQKANYLDPNNQEIENVGKLITQ